CGPDSIYSLVTTPFRTGSRLLNEHMPQQRLAIAGRPGAGHVHLVGAGLGRLPSTQGPEPQPDWAARSFPLDPHLRQEPGTQRPGTSGSVSDSRTIPLYRVTSKS